MKIDLRKEELVQQILYALLGLAFLTMVLSATQARSDDVAAITKDGTNSAIVLTGEIITIAGEGFTLEHDNGMTLVSLEDLQKDQRALLSEANLIKVGNMVTVTGELDKGNFNKPIINATNLVVVEDMPPETPADVKATP